MKKTVIVSQERTGQSQLWELIFTSLSCEFINVPLELVSLQKKISELTPDLLLLDMNSQKVNPYLFCRQAVKDFPKLAIVLTNCQYKLGFDAQFSWAKSQGARAVIPSLSSSLTEIIDTLQVMFLVLNWQIDLNQSVIDDLVDKIKENYPQLLCKSNFYNNFIEVDREILALCEQELALLIGPMAALICQRQLEIDPLLDARQFVKEIASHIPNKERSIQFKRYLLELIYALTKQKQLTNNKTSKKFLIAGKSDRSGRK